MGNEETNKTRILQVNTEVIASDKDYVIERQDLNLSAIKNMKVLEMSCLLAGQANLYLVHHGRSQRK